MFPGLTAPLEISKHDARVQLNLDQEAIYCIFVGRLTQIKRPDRFLDVVEILKTHDSRVKFLIAGDGDLREVIENRISDNQLDVTMLGWQKNMSIAFSAADFIIQCSDNEAVPLVLIEASQHGLPMISTNVGSVSDVVNNEVNGFLTDTSPEMIAGYAERISKDPELREFLGANGRAHAKEFFSLERMVSDHEGLYRSLM